MATTTFEQPGEYLICVRADSFGRIDSSAGNQCCWTKDRDVGGDLGGDRAPDFALQIRSA